MMIDLYVDDVRMPPDGWTLARTVEDAKLHLMMGGVRHLSLDHDMGVCEGCIDDVEAVRMMRCIHVPTGMDLLRWIIGQKMWSQNKPSVHSMNPVRGPEMHQLIEREWPRRSRP